jgi:exopolyphosphatase/guanosine-5'-triphosphate,3'-diphosphate pyrophosphatase
MYIKNYLASGLFSIASLFNVCSADTGTKPAQAKVVTRAAFDIGSGETKVTVADVDLVAQKVLKIKHQAFILVNLRGALETNGDGMLSEKSVRELNTAVRELQAQAKQHGAQESTGVASSIFRTAKNGSDVLLQMQQDTGLTAVLLPQEEEGEVGFATAVAVSNLPRDKLVVWDSGSGSFQITSYIDGKMEVYGEEFAAVAAKKTLYNLRNIPFESAPIHPVSIEEAIQLVDTIQQQFTLPPEWISSEDKQVVAIGGSSIFAEAATALGKQTFTKEDVLQLILESCGKSTAELHHFPTPKSAVVLLALLYAVMEHSKIKELTYYRTNGSTEGLLITPRFWKASPDQTQTVKTAAKVAIYPCIKLPKAFGLG